MTATQYNSNKSLTAEFKWTSFEKRNNLDEPFTYRSRLKKDFLIQISFKRHNPESASKITADPRSTVFSKSANPGDIPHKSTIRALFKAKSVDPKTYSPPSVIITGVILLSWTYGGDKRSYCLSSKITRSKGILVRWLGPKSEPRDKLILNLGLLCFCILFINLESFFLAVGL